jgi:hypothetical protein
MFKYEGLCCSVHVERERGSAVAVELAVVIIGFDLTRHGGGVTTVPENFPA